MEYIDLRSDTVTFPTQAMRDSILTAELGDDGYDADIGDPTAYKLQVLVAEILGKEAALFVPSGCFGNQLCIITHT